MPARRAARRPLALAAAALLALAGARSAGAQAWFHPSFQPPRIAERDYTVGVAANAGTSAVFQWREGLTRTTQLSLDAGLADLEGAGGTRVFVAGQFARLLASASAQQPLDLLFTAGVGLAVGDSPALLRIPVGLSVGHRFPLEGGLALTPYVHPRVTLDSWTSGPERTQLGIDFDVGAHFEVTPQLALRASLLLSGADRADGLGFGLGLTFTPAALRR